MGQWLNRRQVSGVHASFLRRTSALIRRNPNINVVVMVMDGCCVRQRVARLSASCPARSVSYMVAYSSPSEASSTFSTSVFWMARPSAAGMALLYARSVGPSNSKDLYRSWSDAV